MDTIIIFVIMGVVIGLFAAVLSSKRSAKRTLELKDLVKNYDQCHVFTLMPNGLDEHARYIIDKENLYLYIYNCITKKLITTDIKKISKCELIINDNLIQTTNSGSLIGRAIVGGVLMGGVGAVIGGATSSKKTKKVDKAEKGKIVVYYDDLNNPIETLLFQCGKKSIEADISLFHATLCACMAETQKDEDDIRQCPFCAEDIKKAAILCKHCGKDIEPLHSN